MRALVFEDGTTRVAIVSADFLGFPSTLGNKVRAAVKGIAPGNILIGATHTHSAPDCYGFPDGKGGTGSDPKYLELVCTRMAEAINEANEKLQPARLKVATGEAKGKIAYNYYAPQLYDPRCNVIQALDDSGKPIATLVNYAIHPEVLGNGVGICSPDLIGPLYDKIAASGGGTGIFMNSAQGGMVTADNRARGWKRWQDLGGMSAHRRSAGRRGLAHRSGGAGASLTETFLRRENGYFSGGFAADARADQEITQGRRRDGRNLEHTNERREHRQCADPHHSRRSSAEHRILSETQNAGEHNLLFGLTNDAFGYILTKEDYNSFKRYGYVSRTSLGERTGEVLVNEGLKLVAECPTPERLADK